MDKVKLGGMMTSDGRALIRLEGMPEDPAALAGVLVAMGEAGVNLEMLAQASTSAICLVVAVDSLKPALAALELARPSGVAWGVSYKEPTAVISVFGPHLREKPLVPGIMLSALAQAGIKPLALANSISSFSCLVYEVDLERAEEALHQVFELPFAVNRRPSSY